MADSNQPATRAGLPDPSTVVSDFALRPSAAARGRSRAAPPGPAPTYRVLRTNQRDAYDPVTRDLPPALERAAAAANTLLLEETAGRHFTGEARRAAKTSISPAETEFFASVGDLIASLPSTEEMKNHEPRISKAKTSKRVAKEHRNVRLRAFIIAASREPDNDFHLIVGSDPSAADFVCMNMELSGTPPDSSDHFRRLSDVRDVYVEFFAAHDESLPRLNDYDFYDPAVPVEIEGSLFFDINHATGTPPGPKDLQSVLPVVWELHPITEIVFEP